MDEFQLTFDQDNQLDKTAQREYRNTLGQFSTGVAIVTTRSPSGEKVGLTINSFTSLSLSPPMVLWCLEKDSSSRHLFVKGCPFTVSILTQEQKGLAEIFASQNHDRFKDVSLAGDIDGAPIIDGCLAWFECQTVDNIAGGDHTIITGEVGKFGRNKGIPLVFQGGKYLT